MPQYECAVILVPTLSDEQVQEQIEQIKTWFSGLGAQISDVDVWGRKRLAYTLGKFQEGFYVIYYFTFDQGQARLAEFDKRANTTETILRHMIVRLPALKAPPRLPREEEGTGERQREVPPAPPAPPAEPHAELAAADAPTAVPAAPPPSDEAKPAAPESPVAPST